MEYTQELVNILEEHLTQKEELLNHFKLVELDEVQKRIRQAELSLSLARENIDKRRELKDVIYLIGRINWTAGFVTAESKNAPQTETTKEESSTTQEEA
jgi:hypothetical protein